MKGFFIHLLLIRGAPDRALNAILSVVRNVSTPDIAAYEFTRTVMVPVKLVSLFTTRSKTDVLVNWIVASETNSNYNVVERSANGSQFSAAGNIGARNLSQGGAYNFTDLNGVSFASGQALFYHIKIVDKDGRYEYSPFVTVKLDKELVTAVDAYPNPLRNQATLRINVTSIQDARIIVASLDGKTIQQQKLVLQPGTNLVNRLHGLQKKWPASTDGRWLLFSTVCKYSLVFRNLLLNRSGSELC